METVVIPTKILASIVLFRNKPTQVQSVLESLLKGVDPAIRIQVALIDNSPTDILKTVSQDPRVIYHWTGKNVGFGTGHNIALRKFADGVDYQLILNADVQFGHNVIVTLVQYMNQNLQVGMASPQIIYPNGDRQWACKLLPTPFNLFLRRFPLMPRVTKSMNMMYEMRQADYDQIVYPPFLSGCFMFCRVGVLKQLDGFDERFFLYLEDTDLCRRVKKMAEIAQIPSAVAVHEHQKGSHKNWRLLVHHLISAVRYFNKWGWFFDQDRKLLNRMAIQAHQLKESN